MLVGYVGYTIWSEAISGTWKWAFSCCPVWLTWPLTLAQEHRWRCSGHSHQIYPQATPSGMNGQQGGDLNEEKRGPPQPALIAPNLPILLQRPDQPPFTQQIIKHLLLPGHRVNWSPKQREKKAFSILFIFFYLLKVLLAFTYGVGLD